MDQYNNRTLNGSKSAQIGTQKVMPTYPIYMHYSLDIDDAKMLMFSKVAQVDIIPYPNVRVSFLSMEYQWKYTEITFIQANSNSRSSLS